MIKRIANCPFCREGEIAFDFQTMEITVNPDSAHQQPCPHLLGIHGTYCKGEALANGGRKVGVAKVHWQHPGLSKLPPDQLRGYVAEIAVPAKDFEHVSTEQAVKINQIQYKEHRHLSGQEVVRWLDRVGWDKAEKYEVPREEYRLIGWVVFALHFADVLTLLAEKHAHTVR